MVIGRSTSELKRLKNIYIMEFRKKVKTTSLAVSAVLRKSPRHSKPPTNDCYVQLAVSALKSLGYKESN